MNIKKDKKVLIDMLYDEYNRYNLYLNEDDEFIIGIDHYTVSVNIHYITDDHESKIYIEYCNRLNDYYYASHLFTFKNDIELQEEDYKRIMKRYIDAVSDAVSIYNIDLLNPRPFYE